MIVPIPLTNTYNTSSLPPSYYATSDHYLPPSYPPLCIMPLYSYILFGEHKRQRERHEGRSTAQRPRQYQKETLLQCGQKQPMFLSNRNFPFFYDHLTSYYSLPWNTLPTIHPSYTTPTKLQQGSPNRVHTPKLSRITYCVTKKLPKPQTNAHQSTSKTPVMLKYHRDITDHTGPPQKTHQCNLHTLNQNDLPTTQTQHTHT